VHPSKVASFLLFPLCRQESGSPSFFSFLSHEGTDSVPRISRPVHTLPTQFRCASLFFLYGVNQVRSSPFSFSFPAGGFVDAEIASRRQIPTRVDDPFFSLPVTIVGKSVSPLFFFLPSEAEQRQVAFEQRHLLNDLDFSFSPVLGRNSEICGRPLFPLLEDVGENPGEARSVPAAAKPVFFFSLLT